MLKKIKHLFRDIPLRSYFVYLCVALFLTTGVTFSKYITSTVGEDAARVAKFGKLSLTETNTSGNYIYIPGVDISKDPKVSLSKTEMSAYVFVTITAQNWDFYSAFNRYTYSIDNKLSWEVNATDWKFLTYDNDIKQAVFYALVPAGQSLNTVSVIKDNIITVSDMLKNSEMTAVEEHSRTITFKAYAVQSGGFENAASAWNSVKNK